MRIEPGGAVLGFRRRLARENGWSRRYAAEVVREYRRFLYLAATSDVPLTPSDAVDQAWHLAYTRHYWGVRIDSSRHWTLPRFRPSRSALAVAAGLLGFGSTAALGAVAASGSDGLLTVLFLVVVTIALVALLRALSDLHSRGKKDAGGGNCGSGGGGDCADAGGGCGGCGG